MNSNTRRHLISHDALAPQTIDPTRWAAIQLLATDVDGVLTEGNLTFDENGSLLQTFHVRDGFALVVARRAGLRVAWISGRQSKVARKRFEELALHDCILGCDDKEAALLELQQKYGLAPHQTCFIGDDLPDLPAFAVCGLKIAVADAVPEVIACADYVTVARGGCGAVREVVEAVLSAQGHWQTLVQTFSRAAASPVAVDDMQR